MTYSVFGGTLNLAQFRTSRIGSAVPARYYCSYTDRQKFSARRILSYCTSLISVRLWSWILRRDCGMDVDVANLNDDVCYGWINQSRPHALQMSDVEMTLALAKLKSSLFHGESWLCQCAGPRTVFFAAAFAMGMSVCPSVLLVSHV